MTLIVSLTTDDNVIMGADSGTYDTDSGIREEYAGTKIFRQKIIQDMGKDSLHFLTGCAGSVRQRQLLHHVFKPPRPVSSPCDLDAYMTSSYASELRDVLDDAHALSEDGGLEGSAIIAVYGTGKWNNRPHVYELHSSLGITRIAGDWNATGANYQIALGTMAALDLHGWTKNDPAGTVRTVLDIASRYSLFCHPPFRTEHLIED